MWTDEVIQMIITGVGETLYMTLAATVPRLSLWSSYGGTFNNLR